MAWVGGDSGSGKGVASRIRPRYRTALKLALTHLARRPGDAEAARLAALSLSQLGQARRAEPYYQLAQTGGSLSSEDQKVRALGLVKAELPDRAATVLHEVLSQHPDDAYALELLASLYYSRDQLNDALAIAERLAKAPGGAVAGYAVIGMIRHEEQRFEESAAAFEKVLSLDPELRTFKLSPTEFYTELAQALIAAERPADARRHLTSFLAKREAPVLRDMLGTVYRIEGATEEAERCWKRAAAEAPDLYRPWLNLGTLALEAGRTDEAIPLLEKAHARDAEALEPAYQLYLAYHRAGRTEEAEPYRRKAELARQKLNADTGGKSAPRRLP